MYNSVSEFEFEDFESAFSSNEEYLSDQWDEDLNKLSQPTEAPFFSKEVQELETSNEATASRVVHLNVDVPEFIPRSIPTLPVDMAEPKSKGSQKPHRKSTQTAEAKMIEKSTQTTKINFNNASVQTDKSNLLQFKHIEDEEVINEKDRDLRIDMLLEENRKLHEKIENLQEKIKEHSLHTKQQVLTAEHYASINAIKLEAHKESLEDKVNLFITRIDEQSGKLCQQEKNIQMMQSLLITQTVQYLDFQRDVILRHLKKCNTMTNDLRSALPTLSVNTCPTANECRLQADQWKLELEKTERCLTLFEEYSDQVLDCIYTCNFNNIPKAPKEIKLLTEFKNILHDNFIQAVTVLLNEKFFLQQHYHRQHSQWVNNYERSVIPPGASRFPPIPYAGIPHALSYFDSTRAAVSGNPPRYIPSRLPQANNVMPPNFNEVCSLNQSHAVLPTNNSNKPVNDVTKLGQLPQERNPSRSTSEHSELASPSWPPLEKHLLKEAFEDLPSKETSSTVATVASCEDPLPFLKNDEDNRYVDLTSKEPVYSKDLETLDVLLVKEKDENDSEHKEDSNAYAVVQDIYEQRDENNASVEPLPEIKIKLVAPNEYGNETRASATNFFLGLPVKYHHPSNSNNNNIAQARESQGEKYELESVSSNSNNQSKDANADLPEVIKKLSSGFCNLFIYVRENIPETDQMEIYNALKRVRRSMGGLSGKTRETILSHVKQELLSDNYDCRSEASSGNLPLVCVVCLNTTTEKESIILPCSHPFHGKCVTEWFGKNMGCPACQQ